jgi:RimJ/RimL family protein N-acetyltransferase
MAVFPGRERDEFLTHWAKVRADHEILLRTIVADGAVAGNVVSWPQDGQRWVGYWLGREHWGRGIATRALARYLAEEEQFRPLIAHVAGSNTGSVRVLEKAGFRRDSETTDTLVFVLGA